tara:strand:- start:893 stop:1150 length:258 start_codon:yes stop_codon:yes gene_type:complete
MALSKTQSRKLGILLAIMFDDDIDDTYIQEMIVGGYAKLDGRKYVLTPSGLDEKNRLCTLCGLNIKYSSERNNDDTLNQDIKNNL